MSLIPSSCVHRGEGGNHLAPIKEAPVNRSMLSSRLSLPKSVPWMARAQVGLALMAILACAPPAQAEPHDETGTDRQTVLLLLQRIDQLEARLAKLEAKQTAPASPRTATSETSPIASPPQENSSESEPESDQQMGAGVERKDVSKTLLRIRGFGDINFHGDNQKGDNTAFTLGQLNLFVTSDISDKFKFLGEIVFEGGPDNIYGRTRGPNNVFGVDVERMVLQYSRNDYFNLAVGRYHTAIGYYNTAYHHSTWFQTATGRPFLFQFEDRGGILPIHRVGISASGEIPSVWMGLHYVAEVGNGRASRSPITQEPVQNVVDDQNHKAFNLALFARPQAIRGLQVGFSVYRDLLAPINSPRIGETILAAHAVFVRPRFEWLNEALVVRHAIFGTSQVFNTPGFYTQFSRQLGSYRPYFRYQYINASGTEPVFPDVRLRQGPSVRLRD